MPSIGEQGWGELVSNNFEILDTNLNDLQNHIDTINTNIGNGTRTLTLTEDVSNFQQYWESTVYVTYIDSNYTMTESIKPPSSARLCLVICNGNLIISGNLDTYPTSLRSETPPNSATSNTYSKIISADYSDTVSFTYTKSNNSAVLSISKSDLKSFLNAINSVNYKLSIPHAIAAGGVGDGSNGTAGTATNTCNGGGGGGTLRSTNYTGGTGCIFGQYAGGGGHVNSNGYGYGSSASNKYRCALIFVVNGNLTINENVTITQIGGNGGHYAEGYIGGYGGGACKSGGGGAPVFIYYTGIYTNNGTINTAGGSGQTGGNGGAGGIKTTRITL